MEVFLWLKTPPICKFQLGFILFIKTFWLLRPPPPPPSPTPQNLQWPSMGVFVLLDLVVMLLLLLPITNMSLPYTHMYCRLNSYIKWMCNSTCLFLTVVTSFLQWFHLCSFVLQVKVISGWHCCKQFTQLAVIWPGKLDAPVEDPDCQWCIWILQAFLYPQLYLKGHCHLFLVSLWKAKNHIRVNGTLKIMVQFC